VLIQGLEEARAIARGSAEFARRVRRAITARQAEIVSPRVGSLLSAKPPASLTGIGQKLARPHTARITPSVPFLASRQERLLWPDKIAHVSANRLTKSET
jgi:hypothetical protein